MVAAQKTQTTVQSIQPTGRGYGRFAASWCRLADEVVSCDFLGNVERKTLARSATEYNE
jgi:hypothetical protein